CYSTSITAPRSTDIAFFNDPSRIPRVRTDVHYGDQRISGAADVPLPSPAPNQCYEMPGSCDAVEWRNCAGTDCGRHSSNDDSIGSGGRSSWRVSRCTTQRILKNHYL